MSLNPVQFGKDVIDQFGRYLQTTFPIADDNLAAQFQAKLGHTLDGNGLLYKGPYIHLNRPFAPGPSRTELINDKILHPAIEGVFPYETLHKHQGDALAALHEGQHLVLSTGTGSGKTEAFTLPIVSTCLHLRDEGAPDGIVAIIVYPMNALVNDQLDRLRLSLAGTGVTFGRYTGETPRSNDEVVVTKSARMGYTAEELAAHKRGDARFGSEALPLPHEECFTQADIRARKPRILLTNYAQLEYLLLRDKDIDLFREAPLQYMVLDEVHTYTGALGSEVACLIRRLRNVSGKSPQQVRMIGTSATVSDDTDSAGIDTEAMTRRFAHRLFGVPQDDIAIVRESYRDFDFGETYLPPLPEGASELLEEVLDVTRQMQLLTEITDADIPTRLIELTAYVCGGRVEDLPENLAPMEALAHMLSQNRCIARLNELFTEPRTWEEALPGWRSMGEGRAEADVSVLVDEMLIYLTLGVLVKLDGDPLLRPKLHYFVQGLQGLRLHYDDTNQPKIVFSDGGDEENLPLLLCRSCGQHYTRLLAGELVASNDSSYGYRKSKIPDNFADPGDSEVWFYLTDRFHTAEEDEGSDDERWDKVYLCRTCYTIHEKHEPHCLNPTCRQEGTLVPMLAHTPDEGGEPKRCGACRGPNTRRTPLISYTRSSSVANVTVLAQSMLTMMTEDALRKILIFADSRQDAAFQAGWMQERSRRFQIRHLAYQYVKESEKHVNWDSFIDDLIVRAQFGKILRQRDYNQKENRARIGWFMVEEFASSFQRRRNLEQLGLVGVTYGGLDDIEDEFFATWAQQLKVDPNHIRDILHILLDLFRRRGVLSDPLLTRWWSTKDREVREGWVSIPDYWRPTTLVLEKVVDHSMLRGWLASNGRSAAQVAVEKMTQRIDASYRDEFLRATWSWLVEHNYLVPVELTKLQYGQATTIDGVPRQVYQVNVERLGLYEVHERHVCAVCHTAQQRPTPSGRCPEYGCDGELQPAQRDTNHFDVVQYDRNEFVPMVSREHSAQVKQESRLQTEQAFKSDEGQVNTIVATPTLEMGVDIGKLEMVMMRNVPPTPANYAQRSGRAGRRHRIAAVFTHAGGSQHDRYFYLDPPSMIAGEVRVPAFSMQNTPLVRKHAHSTVLSALRDLDDPVIGGALREAFPTYIRDYLSEWIKDGDRSRPRFFEAAPRFPKFKQILTEHRQFLMARLKATFQDSWPDEDQDAVSDEALRTYLDEMPNQLERHIKILFNEVKAYRDELAKLRRIEAQNQGLRSDETKRRRLMENARDAYLKTDIENYTYSWLATNGFFPGYALSRESVTAKAISPKLLTLSRPASVALRELTPANWIYADSEVYGIRRLNFSKLKASDPSFHSDSLREIMLLDRQGGRLIPAEEAQLEGGEQNEEQLVSYRLTDVEMEQIESIDDRRNLRRRVAFDIRGTLLKNHRGGHGGRAGDKIYRYFQQEEIRLVNLGPMRTGPMGIHGFPFSPTSGEARSPFSSEREIELFREHQQKANEVDDVGFFALHVDLRSNTLLIGTYDDHSDAVNAYEGLLVGAKQLLDMGDSELEGFSYTDESDQIWAVLYDPLPGGTGFIEQLLEYWEPVCKEGQLALERCDCQTACYKCMKHFRNQHHHGLLDRYDAMSILEALGGTRYKDHAIPSNFTVPETTEELPETESYAEDRFLERLRQRQYPTPTSRQLRVDLGNGGYIVADFAWEEEQVLVFIDGTSVTLHGDPERARRDRINRSKAKMKGWNVITITTQELDDETLMSWHFDELEVFLGQS